MITASTYGDQKNLAQKDMQNYPASFGGAKLKYDQHKHLLGENYPVSEDVKLLDEWLNAMYLQNTGVAHITKSLVSGAHKGADMMVRGRLIDTICDIADRSEMTARNETANIIRAFKVMLSDFQKLQAAGIINEARAKGVDISQNSELLATTQEGMRMVASVMTSVEDFMMTSENIKTMMLHAGQTIQRTSDILNNMGDTRYEDNIRNIYMINRPGVVAQDMIPDALKNMIPSQPYAQPQPQYGQPAYQQPVMPGYGMPPQQPQYGQPQQMMYIPMGADGKPYTYGNHPINMGPSIPANVTSQQLQDNPNLMVATQPLNSSPVNNNPKSMIDPAAQAVIDMYTKAAQQPVYQQPGNATGTMYTQPQYGQPTCQQPLQPNGAMYTQPQYGQPMYSQPGYVAITPQQPYSDILGYRPPAPPVQQSVVSQLFN